MSTKEQIQQSMQKTSKAANGTMAGWKTADVGSLLDKYRVQIAQALPKHLTADRMIQMATLLITKNPQIAKCSVASILGAVMQASQLGFKPIDALGQCYFVPYGGAVQFQIGYKGYIDLARRSNQLKSIHAFCVYKGDVFEYELGLEPVLKHKPKEDTDHTPENMTHVYAVAHYKDGGYNFIVLTKKEVEKLRMRSPMQKGASLSGAWQTDYDKMAMAKAIKQLSKYMPMSDEFQTAVQSDEAVIKPEDFARDQSGTLENISYPDAEDAEIVQPEGVDEATGEIITEHQDESL